MKKRNKRIYSSSISDKMMVELDSRWSAYKNKTEKAFTFVEVKEAARKKAKQI